MIKELRFQIVLPHRVPWGPKPFGSWLVVLYPGVRALRREYRRFEPLGHDRGVVAFTRTFTKRCRSGQLGCLFFCRRYCTVAALAHESVHAALSSIRALGLPGTHEDMARETGRFCGGLVLGLARHRCKLARDIARGSS